jgi:hypothetical protein
MKERRKGVEERREEKEEAKEETRPVCCEIRNSKLFIRLFTNGFTDG